MGKIIGFIIGIFIVCVGIWWNKKYHNDKFLNDASFGGTTGSFIGDILAYVFIFIMGILPWYVFKSLLIISGSLLIYFVIKS